MDISRSTHHNSTSPNTSSDNITMDESSLNQVDAETTELVRINENTSSISSVAPSYISLNNISLPSLDPALDQILQHWVEEAPLESEKATRQYIKDYMLTSATLDEKGTIHLNGDLNLSTVSNLTSLPNNLHINGNLDLSAVHDLTSLPDNLHVSGNFDISYCMKLTSFSENLSVGGYLNIAHTKTPTLSKNLNVGGKLEISSCNNLISIAENLNIGGDCYVSHCNNFQLLSKSLNVRGQLNLSNCDNFTSFPENFSLGDDLTLHYCKNITSIPSHVIEKLCTRKLDGKKRYIFLEQTNIPEAELIRLSALNSENVHFCDDQELTNLYLDSQLNNFVDSDNSYDSDASDYSFSSQEEANLAVHLKLNEVISLWSDETFDYKQWQLTTREKNQLKIFLTKLHDTAEGKNDTTRVSLKKRVHSLLTHLQDNKDNFRTHALERISQGLANCYDRATFMLNQIEILMHIRNAEASSNPEQSLRTLGKSLLALEVVHKHAAAKSLSIEDDEGIEVYLALEIKLAKDLNLPINTQNMLYENCAELTEKDIDTARNEALEVIANGDNINAFLAQWQPWQKFTRKQESKNVSWKHLPLAEMTFQAEGYCCTISGTIFEEMSEPVSVQGHIFSFPAFKQWWVENGNNPNTMQKVNLSDIQQIIPKKTIEDLYPNNESPLKQFIIENHLNAIHSANNGADEYKTPDLPKDLL